MIHSPHDVDARFSIKRETKWTGYKVHLTEVCDPDAPHLITHVETTPATTQDVERLAPIHAALAAKALLPREHLVDTGYVDAEGLVRSETDYGVRVIGPAHARPLLAGARRAGLRRGPLRGGLGAAPGHLPPGADQRQVVAHAQHPGPRHHQHPLPPGGLPAPAPAAPPAPAARPGHARSRSSPAPSTRRSKRCGSARPRRPSRRSTGPAPGSRATLAQGLRVSGLRHARYVGLAKTHLQHVLTATALNVRRLGAWWDERPFAATRAAAFLALAPAA